MSFLDSMVQLSRPDIQPKDWMQECRMELATVATLDRIIEECQQARYYGCDTETTGLDIRVFDGRTRAKMVGICLAPNPKVGYYLPLRHQKGPEHNLPIPLVETSLRKLFASNAIPVFHNSFFDLEILEYCGGEPLGNWDSPGRFEDTMILAYLRNSRQRKKRLKDLAKEDLNCEMIELPELFGASPRDDLNFSELDPSWLPCIWYGCSDAICTLRLFGVLHPQVCYPDGNRSRGQEVVYNLEKMCAAATRWMERNRIAIDRDKVSELMRLGQQEYFDALCDIYDFCNKKLASKRGADRDENNNTQPPSLEPGWFRLLRKTFNPKDPSFDIRQQIKNCRDEAKRRGMDDLNSKGGFYSLEGTKFPTKYDILSRAQLGPLFEELEIPGLKHTERSNQVKTTQDEIEFLNEKYGHKYPFLPKIKRLGELQKAIGTYLVSLYNDTAPDGTIRVNFKQTGTDTGRFTTPSSKDPKKDGSTKFPLHGTPATYDKSRPQCLLRIREAITVRKPKPDQPKRVLVSVDYSSVELRIATVLSGEPLWLKEYFRCSSCSHEFSMGDGTRTPEAPPPYCPNCGDDKIGDLHTLTAIAFFGEDLIGTKMWKNKRQGAKCVHPETLVFSESGLGSIGRLFEFGEEDTFKPLGSKVTLWNGVEFQGVKSTYNGGEKSLFHVITTTGIVTCSAQHQFLRADGTFQSISEGLDLGVELKQAESPLSTDSDFHKISYFSGLYAACGSAENNKVHFNHAPLDGSDGMGYSGRSWQNILVKLLDPTTIVRGIRHIEADVFEEIPSRCRVPDLLENASEIESYLAGYFDGCAIVEDGVPYVMVKDPIFAGQLCALLGAVGLVPEVEVIRNRFQISIPQVKDSWLRILQHPKRFAIIPRPCSPVSVKILSIISAGVHSCVDVSMKRNHFYWCGGLITHNSANFAMAYGGGPKAILRAIEGSTEAEAQRYNRQFQTKYKGLTKWWDQVRAFGRQYGYVATAFGRQYPVPDIRLPTSPREVEKTLIEEYERKIAAGLAAKRPTDDDIKAALQRNRKFKAKAERNATNGPIQGLSADLTKLAMALIYRECKKRGWLNKVLMIITIHDELVFEIDLDILVEALEMIRETMARNKTVLNFKWKVPLATSCEIGYDWTTPWNLDDFLYHRVRADGLQVEHGGRIPRDKETGKIKTKIWPKELVEILGRKYGYAPVVENPSEEEGKEIFGADWQPPAESPIKQPQAPKESNPSPSFPKVPEYEPPTSDEHVFVFRVSDLGVVTAFRLAQIIVQCTNSGTHPLKIVGPSGENLLWEGAEIRVSPHEFRAAAKFMGI